MDIKEEIYDGFYTWSDEYPKTMTKMELQKQMKRFCMGFLCITLCALFVCDVVLGDTTRWGAKVTKKKLEQTKEPTVIAPDGWKLCKGEERTGINIREYYFTLEAEGKDKPAPVVQVLWPGVEIANVYGGKMVQSIQDGVSFRMTAHKPPTEFVSVLPLLGAVQMAIFHNVKGMQAGNYRSRPYPEKEIAAHLNYLFASREMMREAGFTVSDKSIDGTINLFGFETNFPNGHVDCPPHFHIMLNFDWSNNQVGHFVLAEDGKILCNAHQYHVAGQRNRGKTFNVNEDTAFTDRSGKVRFILRILPDGSGLDMRLPDSSREFRICSKDATKSVSCYVRADASASWQLVSILRVNDDSIHGVLTVETEINKEIKTEVWRYNPENGAILP